MDRITLYAVTAACPFFAGVRPAIPGGRVLYIEYFTIKEMEDKGAGRENFVFHRNHRIYRWSIPFFDGKETGRRDPGNVKRGQECLNHAVSWNCQL